MTTESSDSNGAAPGRPRPIVIGLTGSIASGKSTVAELLQRRGAEVIDADQVYHDLLRSDRRLTRSIVDRFGPSILGPDGCIDRKALGSVVFANPNALQDLEQMTHPAVVAEVRRRIARSSGPVVVVEAIKLVQSGLLEDVDHLWRVTATPEVRARRLMLRNGMAEDAARERIASLPDPVPPDTHVDVTIENSGDIAETATAVENAWRALGIDRMEEMLAAATAMRQGGTC